MKYLLIAAGLLVLAAFSWQKLPERQLIGVYATSLEGRTRNQRHNARLSANEVNGATIGPDETFSFNKRLKGWTIRDGYRKAPVSYNGILIDSWGGGVCQTSSTLYNAALLAGLTIVERHPHVFAPSYLPPGRDAAVAYENVDLRFKNPYPYPVEIHSRVEGDQIKVEIFGSARLDARPAIEADVLQSQLPKTHTIGDGSRELVRNSGKPGYEVRIWRNWGDRKELISHDSYPTMDRVLELK